MLAAILASNLSSSLERLGRGGGQRFLHSVAEDAAEPTASLLALTRGLTIVFGVVQIAIGIWAERCTTIDATVVE